MTSYPHEVATVTVKRPGAVNKTTLICRCGWMRTVLEPQAEAARRSHYRHPERRTAA